MSQRKKVLYNTLLCFPFFTKCFLSLISWIIFIGGLRWDVWPRPPNTGHMHTRRSGGAQDSWLARSVVLRKCRVTADCIHATEAPGRVMRQVQAAEARDDRLFTGVDSKQIAACSYILIWYCDLLKHRVSSQSISLPRSRSAATCGTRAAG